MSYAHTRLVYLMVSQVNLNTCLLNGLDLSNPNYFIMLCDKSYKLNSYTFPTFDTFF